MRIRAFRPLRPVPEHVARVASVPYDVVDLPEARALVVDNTISFLRVTRPDVDLADGVDSSSERAYEQAASSFLEFRRQHVLVREPCDSLYVYRLCAGGHEQHGIAACCHIDEYENGTIRKHERTKPHHENDRARLISALGAQTGPVLLAYRHRPSIRARIRAVEHGEPLFDFTSADGVRHTVWRVSEPGPLVRAFQEVPAAYIADGHHRTAGAVRVGRARSAANPAHTGAEPYNWFLSVLFSADQLRVLPYNRCVRDLNGHDVDSFLAELGRCAVVQVGAPAGPSGPGTASMYLDKTWYGLTWTAPPSADLLARLDVSWLQAQVLGPILGIEDPRQDDRIEFLGGSRGTRVLSERVDSGRAAVAFSMYPTSVSDLLDVADGGRIMPPKSTWFEPKLRSGLFVHTLS